MTKSCHSLYLVMVTQVKVEFNAQLLYVLSHVSILLYWRKRQGKTDHEQRSDELKELFGASKSINCFVSSNTCFQFFQNRVQQLVCLGQ